MKILVLGAGVVGTTTAWYLNQAGHTVTVIDRQPAAGLETSFANGGQISVSHAEPWANPHVLAHLIHWFGKPDAPLRVRSSLRDPDFWRWGLHFLAECWPGRTHKNIHALLSLGLFSRHSLQTLLAEQPIQCDVLNRGILHVYTEATALRRARQVAALMSEAGLDRQSMTAAECEALEPALMGAFPRLLGGDYTASDGSGDAHCFTQSLAALAADQGVVFQYQTQVERLHCLGGRCAGAWVRRADGNTELLEADACVIALGSHSPALLAPLGQRLPIYPAKGYSVTLDLVDGAGAPWVSLTDDQHKLVFSRLGNRLRIAGTAEFNRFDLSLDPLRCEPLLRHATALLPALRWEGEPRFWCGLRPATPSNVPLIGASRIPGLWLNTGHGTLGWTLACGSAHALAILMKREVPPIRFPFYGL